MKSMIASLVVCAAWWLAVAAEAAESVEIIPDVVYGHKFGVAMTLDVVKPRKNANGAGILVMASGAWHSYKGDPGAAVAGHFDGWFDGRRLLSKGFTVFLVHTAAARGSCCPRSSTMSARAVRFVRSDAHAWAWTPSVWASSAGVPADIWR